MAATVQVVPVLDDRNRHVHIEEAKNEIREFQPAASEDKTKLWMSRTQIRQNKRTAKEEVMLERTRGLVKAKLVEETVLTDETNPEALVEQVKALQERLDEIMTGSKEDILAFLKTKFNWITDSNDYWRDLPENVQEAATVLGYTEALWDDFSQQLAVFDKSWQQITKEQQEAAAVLGYNEITWNGSLETDDPMGSIALALADEPETPPSKNSMIVAGHDYEGRPPVEKETIEDFAPIYDWGSSTSDDDSATSDGDGDSDSSSSSSSSGNNTKDTKVPTEVSPMEITILRGRSNSESLEVDEDEFISNFLSDESADLPHQAMDPSKEANKEEPKNSTTLSSIIDWLDDRLPSGWPYMVAASACVALAVAVRVSSPASRSPSVPR